MNKLLTVSRKIMVKTCKTTYKRSRKMKMDMSLAELRQIRNLSQQYLAETMNKKQPNLSKMERSSDMYVSTLQEIIQAMGGSLEIVACFPDRKVRINQFAGLKKKEAQGF